MRKILIVIAALIVLLGIAGSYIWQNFRGAEPAIRPPSSSIVNQFNENGTQVPGENKTQFPLSTPDGFTLGIFAKDLGKARDLVIDPRGTILVSSPNKGEIAVVTNQQNKNILVNHLSNPHGLLLDCMNLLVSSTGQNIPCKLYVAEETTLSVYDYDTQAIALSNKQILTSLPRGGRHTTRTIEFNPTNIKELLISIGSTCDVCVENNPMNGSIQAFNLETKKLRPFATGLRNAVFMTRNPKTNEVWATEMGRDYLGDNLPPDEINIIKDGKNYGWPYCYEKQIRDTSFHSNDTYQCSSAEQSHIDLPAHSAPLGLTFIPENSQWPKEYWGNLLVAYHGSWNRTEPTGYKVVRIVLDEQGNTVDSPQDFITGWLDNNSSLGRPVDLLATEKGELYISDDKAGVVYLLKKM